MNERVIDVEAVPVSKDDAVFGDLPSGNLRPMGAGGDFDESGEGRIEKLYELDDNDDGAEIDVAELDTDENREVLERAKRNVEHYHDLYWHIAEDIHRVNAKRLYRLAGYKKFDDYCQAELEFSKRKGIYLINIYKYYAIDLKAQLVDQPEAYKAIMTKVKEIGWTKAERIAKRRILNSGNATQLFDQFTAVDARGRTPSVNAIEAMVEQEYNSKPEDEKLEADEQNNTEFITRRLSWSKAQFNQVAEALDIVRGMCPPNAKESTHFAWICAEFATAYSMDRGQSIDAPKTMRSFEDMSGDRVIIIDGKTGKVKYGHEAAKALKNAP